MTQARIHVDATRTIGPMPRLGRFMNTSTRFAPPPGLADVVRRNLATAEIIRLWLTLDEVYDYRTNTYDFNYRIGRDKYADDPKVDRYDKDLVRESDVQFEDYLAAFTPLAETAMLNIRRFEREMVEGLIPPERYEAIVRTSLMHYKRKFPNIAWLEVGNESELPRFGRISIEEYYPLYQATCRAVADVNAELSPEVPVAVGGPVATHLHPERVDRFLQLYAADSSPDKRLDFISLHDYGNGRRPVGVEDIRRNLDTWLRREQLPLDLPVMVTEIGAAEGPGDGAVSQTTGLPTLLTRFRSCHDMHPFPWVLYHNPELQMWSTQYLPDFRATPHGLSMQVLAMHGPLELQAVSDAIDAGGIGVYVLASADAEGVLIHAWNYSDAETDVGVTVVLPQRLEGSLRVRTWAIDSVRSNVLTRPDHDGTLDCVGDVRQDVGAELSLTWRLEPDAVVAWRIDQTPAEPGPGLGLPRPGRLCRTGPSSGAPVPLRTRLHVAQE